MGAQVAPDLLPDERVRILAEILVAVEDWAGRKQVRAPLRRIDRHDGAGAGVLSLLARFRIGSRCQDKDESDSRSNHPGCKCSHVSHHARSKSAAEMGGQIAQKLLADERIRIL
ncbi:MAG TPA: hypothetical protein VKB15_12975, partial [Xanthobacteraceae bacterium]|nr:hypothetical protein [Xanthobacteraceae bacterium]